MGEAQQEAREQERGDTEGSRKRGGGTVTVRAGFAGWTRPSSHGGAVRITVHAAAWTVPPS